MRLEYPDRFVNNIEDLDCTEVYFVINSFLVDLKLFVCKE
jgi:hypothetical protein